MSYKKEKHIMTNKFKILPSSTKHLFIISLCISVYLSLFGCNSDFFKYSIHQTNSEYSGSDFNTKNAEYIENHYNNPSEDFTFAVITDSHTYYDELDRAVQLISANPDVKFVIHLGDFTDTGLVFQYEMTAEILDELSVPFLTVLGNHDTLGNGLKIYKDIFGPADFHFICNGVLFLIGNDNNWETNLGDIEPVIDVLTSHQDARYRIIVTHIPIYNTARFSEEMLESYADLCETYNVDLSLHGHTHNHQYIPDFTSRTKMLIADGVLNRNYYLVHVKSSGIEYDRICY